MSYDDTPDVVFNPQDESLPDPSGFFAELNLVPRYYDLPHGDPRFDQVPGQQISDPMQIDVSANDSVGTPPSDAGFLAQSHRARVAHLPQPAQDQQPTQPQAEEAVDMEAAEFEIPSLFPNWAERDIAEVLLTPETFYWWKSQDALAEQGLLPDIPQIYPSGHPNNRPTESFATDGRIIEWEDLHLGVRWLLLLRLSEQHSFAVAIVSQLKLSHHQVHEFVTSYVNHCDQWNAFEKTVMERAMGLEGWNEEGERALLNWLHEKRPLLPYDSLTNEDIQLGLRFLYERCIMDDGVDLVAWFEEKDKKDFAHIKIEVPIMRDCMDHRLIRRAAAAKMFSIKKIENTVKEFGREKRRRAQFAQMDNSGRVPWGDNLEQDNGEMSAEAQTVLSTISTDLHSGEPMPMPIPPYQRQQKAQEAHGALRRVVPELQPYSAPGGLAKTQWEIENGYPYGFDWEYTPLHWGVDAEDMETDPLPEELVKPQPSRVAALRETLTQRQEVYAAAAAASSAQASSAQTSADDSTGQEAERYEQSSSTPSGAALLHNNAPRSRIGTARGRFMTSNERGELMAGQDFQNPSFATQLADPSFATQLAEEGVQGQPELPIGAVEEEPASSLPDLDLAEDLEPGDNVVVPNQRSRRARRPSARARESLQLALELELNAETTTGKPKGRKKGRTSRKRQQGAQAEGSQSPQSSPGPESDESTEDSPGDDGVAEVVRVAPVAQGGPEPAQEVGVQAEAAATGAAAPTAPIVVPRMQARGSLVRPRATARSITSLPTVDEVPTGAADGRPQLAVGEPSPSGSEAPAAPDAQRISAAKRRTQRIFGISRTQELNSCPPPVSETHSAWTAEVAQFAVEAIQASYALKADRIIPDLLVAPQYQMDEDTIKATITSMEAQYARIESMSRSENGPVAQTAEFAGVTDMATFAIHAAEAAFAFEEEQVMQHFENATGSEEPQPQPEV
ncbi:hypothetical protein BBK36DRAFT_1177788 [Trichoderma citrinoviride]|uniref:Uncharacterized protein n=1 Tax=Trichoderma citrinoviride TaxID=58853 RepID=A0A2T4B6F0_9HYPO|nr:hypothetical protein BBK36DRAFT_1177788 [Trichoderma citrinoviride]PTB64902.1 hypothetical protein BBK36DRAFT_1177788 [Trichoderma citrinoviride]